MSTYKTTRVAIGFITSVWVIITFTIGLFSDDVRGLLQNFFLSQKWPENHVLIVIATLITGILVSLFFVFRLLEKVSHLSERSVELTNQLDTDSRSGLSSYEYLKAKYQDEYFPEVERGVEFSVLMVDIVGFKKINDTMGHDVGDEVISIVGGFLKSFVRGRRDIAARYGEAADEFFFIISGDIAALRGFTVRLISELNQENLFDLNRGEFVDYSIELWTSGTAIEKNDSWADILKRLSNGLVKAKSESIKGLVVVSRDNV